MEDVDKYSSPLVAVTRDGTVVSEYDTLLDAMNAFNNREVNAFAIRLMGNHYCDALLPDMWQDVAIDLNGYKLTLSEGIGIDIYTGVFNFFDSRGGGLLSGNRETALIAARSSSPSYNPAFVRIRFENINIENTGPALYVYNQSYYFPLDVEIDGGKYLSAADNVLIIDGWNPTIEISAGDFVSPPGIAALKGCRGDLLMGMVYLLVEGSEIDTAAGEYISLAPLVNNTAANKITVSIKP